MTRIIYRQNKVQWGGAGNDDPTICFTQCSSDNDTFSVTCSPLVSGGLVYVNER